MRRSIRSCRIIIEDEDKAKALAKAEAEAKESDYKNNQPRIARMATEKNLC
jgi:hypothetical protein